MLTELALEAVDFDTVAGTTAGIGVAGVAAGTGVAEVVCELAVGTEAAEAAGAADVLAGRAGCTVLVELGRTAFELVVHSDICCGWELTV